LLNISRIGIRLIPISHISKQRKESEMNYDELAQESHKCKLYILMRKATVLK